MALEEEIKHARTDIVSDGYEMSIGEVLNLYRDGEIVINPDFQRLYRWEAHRKTKFIESILLGIPIPPIFVYQDENGVWELIDGLQRVSTLLEFVGLLNEDPIADLLDLPLVLNGTHFLPSLENKAWEPREDLGVEGIGVPQQRQIKRSRIRVEILKQESDPRAKYELFQRLNTGGATLSEQEVRNCVAVMLDRTFNEWIKRQASKENFVKTINITETAQSRQLDNELVLRFFSFRNVPYEPGLDVHEYLNEATVTLATDEDLDRDLEESVFDRTFALLNRALGDKAFRRWDGNQFTGKFLMSVFEVVAIGVSKNIEYVEGKENSEEYLVRKCQALWSDPTFRAYSGAGTRGTSRLANLLPLGEWFFSNAAD